MVKNIYGVVILVLNIVCVYGGLTQCCLRTSKPECRRKCELLKLNEAKKLTRRKRYNSLNRRLTDIVATCPRSEDRFWRCLPSTKVWRDYVRRQQTKRRRLHHGFCCKDAVHKSCEIHCYTTKNVSKVLNENCNQIREPKLWECVTRIRASKKCCHGARGECRSACKRYFDKSYYNSVLDGKSHLERKCGRTSYQYKCIMKKSDFKNGIKDFKMCCSSGTAECERECHKGLQQLHNYSVLLDTLPKYCGAFNWETPIYKCLVQTAMEEPREDNRMRDRTFIDRRGPKKQCCHRCCHRAKSEQCRNWCTGMTSAPSLLGTWEATYLSCTQDPKEVELSNCMSDILEPCKIGAKSEMKFCTNFNNRPLELFRRCDEHGDNEARELYKLWSDGVVRALDYNLFFNDISKCKPEKFKAMACLISIKPCDHTSSRRQVCRRDCEELLNACVDNEKLDEPVNAELVCAAMLPKDNQTDCIPVSDYLTPKHDDAAPLAVQEVTQPCDADPCGKGEVCVINRECVETSPIGRHCKLYTCIKGCRVSGQTNLFIPIGQRAKLRVASRGPWTVDRGQECYQVCICKQQRTSNLTLFNKCKNVGCKRKRNCTLKKMIFNDAEEFSDGCNTCTCDDGELLCTKNYCGYDLRGLLSGRPRRHHTTLSIGSVSTCNCGDQLYNPVCGVNGMTYPNPCVARCCDMDGSKTNIGDCDSIDPCKSHPCKPEERCIPRRTVCLSTNPEYVCPQYECTEDVRYDPTGCLSHATGKESDYVCGYNSVEYKSKCLALASGTGVDYHGPCLSKRENIGKIRCTNVMCPEVEPGECHLFQPPGTCCPVCGSMLRILYSHRDLTRHHNFIPGNPITVIDVVKQLRHLQKVAECTLYGHRTIEGDIIVLILVNTKKPTKRQVHACVTEAERINKYINNESPVVTPFYHLSILKVSRLKKAKWKDYGSSSSNLFNSTLTSTLLCICTLIVLLLDNRR